MEAEAPDDPVPVLRLGGDGLASGLDTAQIAPLVAAGQVTIIALDAIAERLGPRWPVRQGLIHDHAGKILARQVGPRAIVQRISDTDFLVANPDATRLAGQALCLNGLREILQHFLGEALVADLRVHEVTRITPTGVYGQKLDAAAVEAAEVREREAAASAPARPGGVDQWTPFVSADGRRVRVSCVLEPVIHLKTSARIGYRMARRVLWLPSEQPLTPREQAHLARADIEKVDFATISRGLDRLRNERDSQLPTLIVPVSYITLSSVRGRAILVDFMRQAKEEVRHGLICEVCDIEGVPPGALLAAASLVRPFCLHVIGRVKDTARAPIRALKEAGLQGLSLDGPACAEDAEFIGWSKGLVDAARPVTRTLFLYRLGSVRQAAIASMLGITHASLASAPGPAPRQEERETVLV